MRPAITLGLGLLLAAAAPGMHAQANPSTAAGSKAAAQQAAKSAASASGAAAKPAAQAPAAAKGNEAFSKAPLKQAPKSPAVARPAKPVEKPVNPDEAKDTEEKSARRDPFESLIMRQQAQKAAAAVLPPGKAGLQVSTLRLDGIVKAPSGMIAVVTNPQARTYFLREGDQLYDGRVEKIAMDGVSFHEMGKDAFGKPVEHQVNKRIYASAGEQQ